MSFVISNLATNRQKNLLAKLGYIGRGKYTLDRLNSEAATQLLKELWEEQRLERIYKEEQFKEDIMSFIASDKGGDFEITPEDTYTARCYRMLALGTQEPNNPTYKPAFQIMISWELIGKDDPHMQEGDNKGKPFSQHQKYNLSLGEKSKLRAHLEAWRGKHFTKEELKSFDVSTVLGTYCTLQIVHSEDGKYANISSIMAYKGEKPEPVNKDVLFDIEKPDMDIFNSLSDSIRGTIMQAPEWIGTKTKAEPSKPVQVDDVVITDINEEEPINLDDIPF